MFKVPFIKPDMPSSKLVGEMYEEIVSKNWFTNFGPKEKLFSTKLATYVGNNTFASTVNNATSGLIIAILAIMDGKINRTKKRNKVLIPSFTFAAGVEAILWCGLEPVFIDVDPITWQPDEKKAAKYLNSKHEEVVGILFCNIFGVGASNIYEWEELAKKHNVFMVVDSAAGFGSKYTNGELLGARGDCEVFSFHATKPFGVGEGGAITTKSLKIKDEVQVLQNFGFNSKKEVVCLGFNAKLQEINAAIGLFQLDNIDKYVVDRQNKLKWYVEVLEEYGFTFQPNAENSSVCFASALAPNSDVANKLYEAFRNAGVESNRYYNPPLHKHPLFMNNIKSDDLTVTEDICSRIISLPVHSGVGENEKTIILEVIEKVLK